MGHVLLNVRAIRRLPLIAVATVALAGCDSPSQPAAGHPDAAPPAGRADAARLARFLFHDARYEADGGALYRARQVLVRRCMSRQGFAFHADDGALPPPPDPALPHGGYGLYKRISGVDTAVRRAARDQAHGPNASYVRALSASRRAAYERALDGPPDRRASVDVPGGKALEYPTAGCYANAIAHVERSVEDYYDRLVTQNAAAATVNHALGRDSALRDSMAAWRDCMRARGLRFPSPADARGAVYDAYIQARAPERVRGRERRTAAADRACGIRSGFYGRLTASRTRALRSLTAAQVRATLESARERHDSARRAREILRGPLP